MNPRSKNCSMAPCFGPTSHKSAHFFRLFLISGQVPSMQRYWRKRIALLHVHTHSPHKQNIVSPSMMSQANLPHSSLLFGHGTRKWPILGTLKNYTKLTKIATMITFLQRWSENQGDLYKRKNILGVSCTWSIVVVMLLMSKMPVCICWTV